jgi:hypothetical protein
MLVGEPGVRAAEDGDAVGPVLGREDLAVSQAAVSVDGGVDEQVAAALVGH